MPRILRVVAEENLTALRTRLVRADATPAEVKRAEKAVRAANPHLDFGHLERGTVVVVPDATDIKPAPSEHVAADLLETLERQLLAGLEAIKRNSASGEKRLSAEASDLKRLVKTKRFKKAVGEDEGLKRKADALVEAVDSERELSKSRKKELRDLLKTADRDLDRLKDLFG